MFEGRLALSSTARVLCLLILSFFSGPRLFRPKHDEYNSNPRARPNRGRARRRVMRVRHMFEVEDSDRPEARRRAVELFRRAYSAQLEENYGEAVELYRRSIETYPTAEAHTFLGWVYSFDGRYAEAIDECLKAITVDSSFRNPYNDIGSYLLAQGHLLTCIRLFLRAPAPLRLLFKPFPFFH